ncbi:MAG: hypothetical protein U0Q16_33720 [Bryobacteraceae bacterium]
MSSYLEGYGAGEERRSRLLKRLAVAVLAGLVIAFAAWYFLRDYREKQRADEFLTLVRAGQLENAYKLWGCTEQSPCRDYPYQKFLDDWGAKGGHDPAKMNVSSMQHCRSGIIKTVSWGSGDNIPLWVNRGDLSLSIAPWPRCDFNFQMPVQ